MTASSRIGNVILIDDEKISHTLYQRAAKRSGLVDGITGFHYAEEALDHLKSAGHPPVDAIFLDINMPRMDGFEFLEAATEDLGPDFANVIMLSSSENPDDIARARSFDAVKDYVSKPMAVDQFQSVADLLQGLPKPQH